MRLSSESQSLLLVSKPVDKKPELLRVAEANRSGSSHFSFAGIVVAHQALSNTLPVGENRRQENTVALRHPSLEQ